MSTKKGVSLLLALIMAFSVFTGMMMTTSAAETGSVKLEVYEYDSENGNFGTKLNLDGENPDTLKVGKDIIVAVQVYGYDKIVGNGGLCGATFGLTYDSSTLVQSMEQYADETILAQGESTAIGTSYANLDYVVNNSALSNPRAPYSTVPEEYNKELKWYTKLNSSGKAAYQSFDIEISNNTGTSERYLKVMTASGGAYYENASLRPLAADPESKKMLYAFKFNVKAIPTAKETTLSLDTSSDTVFKIDKWKDTNADGGNALRGQGYQVLTGAKAGADGVTSRLMDDVSSITAAVTNPSDTPVIDTTNWNSAVEKVLDPKTDQYLEGSRIHVKGTKNDAGAESELTPGLKLKLFDEAGTQLHFLNDDNTTSDAMTVKESSTLNDFPIDLSKVRYAGAPTDPIQDQTLYLAAQQDGKGDSTKVEIIENSPAPVITTDNATKVIDFTTGKLTTGSEVTITHVKKPVYANARDLVAGSEVRMFTVSGSTETQVGAPVTAALDANDNKVKATFNLDGLEDVEYYFTVKEPNGVDKVPTDKATSLKTALPEVSKQPVIDKVTKENGKIKSFQITGLKKSNADTAVAVDSNVAFKLMNDTTELTSPDNYTTSLAGGVMTVTLTTALAPKVTVSATQTVDGVELWPSNAVEVEMKVGKPIITEANINKTFDPATGNFTGGTVTVTDLEGDGKIPANIELVLKNKDGQIVNGACVGVETPAESGQFTWTITLPAGEDQTFTVIAQEKEAGLLKPSDPAVIPQNSKKPSDITITNNFNAAETTDKTYEIVVSSISGSPIGKDDVLYIYKGSESAKGDLVATVNATQVAVATMAAEDTVTYEFRKAFTNDDGSGLSFNETGAHIYLEVQQTVEGVKYLKSLPVYEAPVPSEINVEAVLENLDAVTAEGVRDAAAVQAMAPYLLKKRVAIPEGAGISKAELEGYMLNDKVVVEFNVAVTVDGVKSKYHAVPVTWTKSATSVEEANRTAIDATTTNDTEKAAVVAGNPSSTFMLYGKAYDMNGVLTGAELANFTQNDGSNVKPEVTMVVKVMPKIELAEGNWNETIEGPRPEGEEATVHTYVNCYFRDPGLTIKQGTETKNMTEVKRVKRYAYDGETLLNPDGNSLAPLPDVAGGEAAENLDIFVIRNPQTEIDDANAPGGKRTIGSFKHGNYTMKYVYEYVDTELGVDKDIITVKGAENPHMIEITAERKVVIRYMRGDTTLDGQVDLTDISPLATNVMKNNISDAVYFEGYCKYVADTYIDNQIDLTDISPLTTHVMKNNYVQDYTDYLLVE